jgi:hypothetical protein
MTMYHNGNVHVKSDSYMSSLAERESVASCRHATSRTATSASYMVDLERLSTVLDAQERSGKITVKT